MAIIYPAYDRAAFETRGAMLRITIPVARAPLETISVLACLILSGGLLASWIGAPGRGMSMETKHIALALIVSVVSAGMALWYFLGKEIIEIDRTTLKRIRQIPFFHSTQKYSLAKVANLRPATDVKLPSWLPGQRLSHTTFGGGRIAFDYGGRSHRLGFELSDSDMAHILDAMRTRVPPLYREDMAAESDGRYSP